MTPDPPTRAFRAAKRIIETLTDAGHTAYLAGGCVRDLLLSRQPKDYDVATDARPERISSLFKKTDLVGAQFGVVLVRLMGEQTEVATFRSDGPYSDGRHPDSVRFGDARQDALRRDFTVNGLFYDVVHDQLIDYVHGQADLQRRVIRTIGSPAARFAEDHLRILRAVRFASTLSFDLDPETRDAMRAAAASLATISSERTREELKQILTAPTRPAGWRILCDTTLCDHLVEGLTFDESERDRVAGRLHALPSRAEFRLLLACLLADRPVKEAVAICRRLRCSNDECNTVRWLLGNVADLYAPDRLELADIKRLLADDRFDLLADFLRVELTARGEPLDAHAQLLSRCRSIDRSEIAPPAFVTGDDLLARKVAKGPAYARILEALYRAQLNQEIRSRAQALDRLDALIAEINAHDET